MIISIDWHLHADNGWRKSGTSCVQNCRARGDWFASRSRLYRADNPPSLQLPHFSRSRKTPDSDSHQRQTVARGLIAAMVIESRHMLPDVQISLDTWLVLSSSIRDPTPVGIASSYISRSSISYHLYSPSPSCPPPSRLCLLVLLRVSECEPCTSRQVSLRSSYFPPH